MPRRKRTPEELNKETPTIPLEPRKGDEVVQIDKTKAIVEAVAKEISENGLPYRDSLKWIAKNFNMAETTARRYYAAAMKYLRPEDPEKYREGLIDRNFAILESMLQKALKKGDLKNANAIINTLNKMVGIGGNRVEIKDNGPSGETKTITISFA